MAKTAFVLGGTGFVGRHVVRRLAECGWDVTVASRGETPMPEEIGALDHVAVDRGDDAALKRALGGGVDVLVDVIPYERRDAEQVLALRDLIGSVVGISSASVYADDEGRTLEEVRTSGESLRLPVPIKEKQRTAVPGDDNYSTKKAAIEKVLTDQDEVAATVIRPCAIYGPGDTLCREWFFVKRALDRRPHVLLAHEGKSVFHTTSVHNVAEMVRLAAERPGTRVLNCGDPDPPDVLRISRTIAEVMGHDWTEILVPPEQSNQSFVRNPWAAPTPFVVDMRTATAELDYEPVMTYDDAIGETVSWIVGVVSSRDWREALPRSANYLAERFDYGPEDSFVRGLS